MKKSLLALVLLFGLLNANDKMIEESAQINYGAQLYDKWFKVMPDAKTPQKTHPSYKGKKKGNTTWRCKECHGWDYKGVAGAYSKGSHYTGFKGVDAYKGKSLSEIIKVLNNDMHKLQGVFGDKELNALALFISRGQVDASKIINMKTKEVKGNHTTGAILFNAICSNCHGLNGKIINFKEAPKEVYVGDAARGNPWETLHKIRFGHPGSNMVSLFVLPQQSQVDILSYIMTLK